MQLSGTQVDPAILGSGALAQEQAAVGAQYASPGSVRLRPRQPVCAGTSAECPTVPALAEVASLQLWQCLLCPRLVCHIQLQVSVVQVFVW